ncbi:hypothetical protein DH2020_017721 [Rehmannia glutinosa]|uniref:Pectinesterase inhibitor domain-containing protein n=1 Tax=Rehmannia glutinosa TaxID=99300 RepID=A0ABR0WUD5_REHGL
MASFRTFVVLILISIIFISVTPSSAGHKMTDTEINYLCSRTINRVACYKFLKSDPRTANVDAKGIADVSIDLASKEANKIMSRFNRLAEASKSQKTLYRQCAKNYNDAIRDLEVAKKNLHAGVYKYVHGQVQDASEEIKSCDKLFKGKSNIPVNADIMKKNQDFEFLLSVVKVLTDNLNIK